MSLYELKNQEISIAVESLGAELKSLKKKFKDKRFAAGCSRDVITNGAELLGWELDRLLDMTLRAMQAEEEAIEAAVAAL